MTLQILEAHLSMIQAQGQRRPGAANMGEVARNLIYQGLQP